MPESARKDIIPITISEQMYQRFEKNKIRRNIASILFIVTYLIYLAWRITIFSENSMTLSVIYFIAELITFILGFVVVTSSISYKYRKPISPPEGKTVDVLLPVYLEPVEMIRRTIIAARDIEYPHGTIVLDDGQREEVKKIAEELGVQYYSRTEHVNAKAGNLNYGLQFSNAEFFLVFDADFIALPHAISALLGFFEDEEVAIAQAPQDYYNTDGFQYVDSGTGKLWNDQSHFFNIGQQCKDNYNGASCVGTCVMYRRDKIDEIGGIPHTTITEDIHTSIKLHKIGCKMVYLNERIAYGEASPDLKEYYKTRHRWGHGNLHAFKHENVASSKDLTPKQRWSYTSMGLMYLEGWQQLLVFLVPVLTLIFGLQPFEITIFNVLVVLLFPLLSYIFLQESGVGFYRFWPNEILSMSRWPIGLISCAALIGKKIPWRTSTKNIKAKIHWNLMFPQIAVMLISLSALIFAICKVGLDYKTGPLYDFLFSILTEFKVPEHIDVNASFSAGYTVDLVMIAGFWASYNIVKVICFLHKVFKNAKNSNAFYRFEIPIPVRASSGSYGRVNKVSETWISYKSYGDGNINVGDETDIKLLLPSGFLSVKVQVENVKSCKGGNFIVEGSFVWNNKNDKRDVLANSLYSVDWHREFLAHQEYFSTPLDLIYRLFTFGKKMDDNKMEESHNPLVISLKNNDEVIYGVITRYKKSPKNASLITFSNLRGDQIYSAIDLAELSQQQLGFKVIGEEPISSLSNKCLDGAIFQKFSIEII